MAPEQWEGGPRISAPTSSARGSCSSRCSRGALSGRGPAGGGGGAGPDAPRDRARRALGGPLRAIAQRPEERFQTAEELLLAADSVAG